MNLQKHLNSSNDPSDSYWLMRRLFAFGLGVIYLNLFIIFWNQGVGLLGENGILPIKDYFPRVWEALGGVWNSQLQLPSLFHFNQSDVFIKFVGLFGICLSMPLLFGFVSFPILFVLWILQMSIVHAGQDFWGFGWETQILELTFLSFFLFPLWNPRLDNPASPPKKISIIFMRWMMFRLMLGAGLIKLRGDSCWRDLTCMNFHYETQPNPSPMSWMMHKMPPWVHSGEVIINHFVEVLVPFALFGPKWLRRGAGVIMIVFQSTLILSGNLAWLNWLTLLMAVPCFDDEFLSRGIKWKKYLNLQSLPVKKPTEAVLILFLVGGVLLSIEPALNLISSNQVMNGSFNRLHLINSYGAFGSITKERNEVIIFGTNDDPKSGTVVWKEYEFKCKPGNLTKRPCLITPYHLHLDWQIWFAAMYPKISDQWLANLALRLLEGRPEVLDLMEVNPFAAHPPKYIKMDLYRYHFTGWTEPGWWKREYIQSYLEPVSL